MEREYVDKNHWLDREEFMDIMVVAQTTPGIFSIDMASHIGYKLRGVWGGIVGALGIALPSIIAILLIAIFFHNFKDNVYVEKFFRGVRPAVVALIAAPCFKMARTAHITWSTCWIPVVSCLLRCRPSGLSSSQDWRDTSMEELRVRSRQRFSRALPPLYHPTDKSLRSLK